MSHDPTYKKLKRILEQLKEYDLKVDEHIKNELERHTDKKTDAPDQPTQDDTEPAGDGDQPDSSQEGVV